MDSIKWGIIGCGDVTELKSGPAFNKVNNSSLVAVMRRDAAKAKDYAERHAVPVWYSNANDLINDPNINAIYIATPPGSHEAYTLAALAAGKPVYVEKPMTLNRLSAMNMLKAVQEMNGKLVVAHYRREQPLFKKIKQLLADKVIGEVRAVRLDFYRKLLSTEELAVPKTAWRVDAAEAGGGLFHDIAPHQLDLMYYFFGEVAAAVGFSLNQGGAYTTDDMVAGTIRFKNGVIFSGQWSFAVNEAEEKDYCEIIGSQGKIAFAVFEHSKLMVTINGVTETILFEPIQHVQQPMIEKVVAYFLGESGNPCSAEEGVKVMDLLDRFTDHSI